MDVLPCDDGIHLACSMLRKGAAGGPWTPSITLDGHMVVGSVIAWGQDTGSGTGGPTFNAGGAMHP